MTDTMFDAGKNARRETNAIKGWIEEKLPFWDEVIDVDPWTNQVQISRFPGKWSPVFNRIMPEIGGYVLVIRVADEFLVMGPPPEEETQVQTAPEDPIDAEEGQIYKIVHEDDTFTLVTVVETPSGRVYKNVSGPDLTWKSTFLFEFGEEGSSPGQFGDIRGIDVDNLGFVYVTSDDRVQKFDSSGAYVATLATPGSGDTEVSAPQGITYNPRYDTINIADTGNERILVLTRDGGYVSEAFKPFGFVPLDVLNRPDDGGISSVYSPNTNAISDSFGRVWYSRRNLNEIQVYSPNEGEGFFLDEEGTGPGQLNAPGGIGIGPSGIVYIADSGNNRIQVLNSSGIVQGFFGSSGINSGQFDNPTDVVVTKDRVYVADSGNNRIQVFSNPSIAPVEEIVPWNAIYLSKFGTEGAGPGQFQDGIRGIAVRPDTGDVYVSSGTGASSKVQKFTANGTFASTIATYGTGDGEVDTPWGMEFSNDGTVYIVDSGNHRVQYFTAAGAYSGKFGTSGSGSTNFSDPRGLSIAGNMAHLYVADTGNSRISQWNVQTATHLTNYTIPGLSAPGDVRILSGLLAPRWLVTDVTGNAVTNAAIRLIDGGPLFGMGAVFRFGSFGASRGQFNTPDSIAIDSMGNIYVTDTGNHRVQVFDSAGVFRGQFGGFGNGDGEFNTPTGIAITGDYIYVCDSGNHRVQIFANPVAQVRSEVGVGFVNMWAGDTDPDGWLICDGRAIDRSVYADLFSVIGTSYGAGNSVSTFNIPNLKGRVVVGFDSGDVDFSVMGKQGGEKNHLLTQAEGAVIAHAHSLAGGQTTVTRDPNGSANTAGIGGNSTGATGVSASTAHNNMQPYLVMNYIIKY